MKDSVVCAFPEARLLNFTAVRRDRRGDPTSVWCFFENLPDLGAAEIELTEAFLQSLVGPGLPEEALLGAAT